jgi:hypothetical protein
MRVVASDSSVSRHPFGKYEPVELKACMPAMVLCDDHLCLSNSKG